MKELFRKLVVVILNWEARQYIKNNKSRLIFVCGIINRSNTKDEIVAKLQTQGKAVRGSFKGYNAAIGLPLSILNLEAGYHSGLKWLRLLWQGYKISQARGHTSEKLVLEVSVANEHESQYIMANYQPEMLIITDFKAKISQKESILASFRAIINQLAEKGTILLNGDYAELVSLKGITSGKFIVFGTQNTPDILLNKICEQEKNTQFSYINKGVESEIVLNKFGIHNIYSRGIAEYLGN
jgi:UDP-N-acetylmuramyl pentapeptide synthase